ncbi:MAG: hypothetical protein WC655_02690 [Candidatus Hydrogenedentales bacterium]
MRWLWTIGFAGCAMFVLPGCQTLGAVSNLANAIVGTAVQTASKALSAETYKRANSSTTAKQDTEAYNSWAKAHADQYKNYQGKTKAGSSTRRTKSTAGRPARKRDVAYTRFGVEIEAPKKARRQRSHAPTSPYWQE